jgi:hypothetical protein
MELIDKGKVLYYLHALDHMITMKDCSAETLMAFTQEALQDVIEEITNGKTFVRTKSLKKTSKNSIEEESIGNL